MRIAVIGHVEHVTIARVPALPVPGEIAHLDGVVTPGGGGGIAFFQLAQSDDEIHLFTALGNDDAARLMESRLLATGAHVHAARRDEPHTRDVVLLTPDGERTILVLGEPLHPRREDDLPWGILATCDAAYFTAQDAEALKAARTARLLVVTARRKQAIAASGVRADVIVGSVRDPREAGGLSGYEVPPAALVMTDGARGGMVESSFGFERFAAAGGLPVRGSYGAGDSFAAALTWYVAQGHSVIHACRLASAHGAAVLSGDNPLDHQLPLR